MGVLFLDTLFSLTHLIRASKAQEVDTTKQAKRPIAEDRVMGKENKDYLYVYHTSRCLCFS